MMLSFNIKSPIHKSLFFVVFLISHFSVTAQRESTKYHEKFRPQYHFTPAAHWMNDPNGMVYFAGIYHLFYQYYPDSSVWGPMHWGHASSKDMLHWQHEPIALYPDSLGYIFSGSAVADIHNSSGFGKNGIVPLVAIFTNHDPRGEAEHKNDFQTQGIAYSLDSGKSWTKYAGNPVLHNPGIRDFRDPKVSWNEALKLWIMTLATMDRITFFSSPNLRDWRRESDFGANLGSHAGVWECPDLFPMQYHGKSVWVLLVSINPGAPNGGSGTQYFTGVFDGHQFRTADTTVKWVDYGPDDYAGVTWSNTGMRRIFLGWMSNWEYATRVPTETWRSANTLPRELALREVDGTMFLSSTPVNEVNMLVPAEPRAPGWKASKNGLATLSISEMSRLNVALKGTGPFQLSLSNKTGERVIIGYNAVAHQYFIDRSKSGNIGFSEKFANRCVAPRLSTSADISFQLFVDASSIELFADGGLTNMTALVFPSSAYTMAVMTTTARTSISAFDDRPVKRVWK